MWHLLATKAVDFLEFVNFLPLYCEEAPQFSGIFASPQGTALKDRHTAVDY
jgi:hypothetical protein